MDAQILPEHQWLEQFIGVWVPAEDSEAPKDMFSEDWIETGRSLQGTWVVVEGAGKTPGTDMPASTLMSLGFDPAKGKYVGTWLGSMMNHLWVYEGAINADGALDLFSIGPNFEVPGEYQTYRDSYAFGDDGTRTLTSSVQGADGTWQTFMTATYRKRD